MGSASAGDVGVAHEFVPEAPALAGSLTREMRRVAGQGDALLCIVRALAGTGTAGRQAMGAVGLAAAVWRVHRGATSADSILAGDALLTRALELGATLPDTRCRAAFLTYVINAFSASERGGRFLLAAALEIGVTIGGWRLEPEGGSPGAALAELVEGAGGPLITPTTVQRPPESLQAQWAALLASPELNEWR